MSSKVNFIRPRRLQVFRVDIRKHSPPTQRTIASPINQFINARPSALEVQRLILGLILVPIPLPLRNVVVRLSAEDLAPESNICSSS